MVLSGFVPAGHVRTCSLCALLAHEKHLELSLKDVDIGLLFLKKNTFW